MIELLINILGWLGSALLIIAYYRNSKNLLSAQSQMYQGLNIVGSIFLIINTVYYGAYPSSAVNIIWVVIGIIYFNKKQLSDENIH